MRSDRQTSPPADAVTWHSQIAGQFHGRYRSARMFRQRVEAWTLAIARHVPPHSFALDLGCGSGVFSAIVADRAARVLAIDGSEEMIRLARAESDRLGLRNIVYVVDRLERFLDHTAEPADAILCSSVFEYLPNPDSFLADCFSALKPTGKLLISVPNGRSWYRVCEKLAFRATGHPAYLSYVQTMESGEAMSARLKGCGFVVAEWSTFGSLPFLSTLFRSARLTSSLDTLTLIVGVKPVP